MAGKKDIVEQALKLISEALQSENEIKNVKIGSSALQFRKTPEGIIELYSLRTPQSQRGKGSARSAMEQFLSQTDAFDLPVKLDASPLDKKTDTQRLVNFYNSLGFEQTGRSNNYVGDPEMVRQPVSKPTDKANGGSIRQGYGPGGWVDDVVKMAGKVISGEGDDAAKAGIRAYQGSPHNFAAERLVRFPTGKEEYLVGQPDVLPDVPEGAEVLQDFPLGRMRMDKIGTGEGAQAYGHGLYFAEHEPVARGYRDALTYKHQPKEVSAWINAVGGDKEAAVKKYMDDMGLNNPSVIEWEQKNRPDLWAEKMRTVDAIRNYTPGSMYEVRINADPATLLDWDKPLSEQPSLTRALGNYDPEYYVDYDEIIHKAMQSLQPVREPTGEDIYRALGHPKTATRMLNTMGVPGIRFLDAGSRVHDDTAIGMIKNYGSREKALEVAQKRLASAHHSDRASWQKTVDALSRPETRNLVVFDDKLISIIRKYGIAGASAMLGYNLMEQLDPKQALAASMADQDYQASRPQRSMGGNNSISGALNVARGLNGGE